MSRAPKLTDSVVLSLEQLINDLAPAMYLGTDKEPGVKYLTALVKHHREPASVARRRRAVVVAQQYRRA